MAKRKVGNMLALAILSTIVTRPMHPYEMASILRTRGKDNDMKIKWGSLYTVVQNLEKHGFIVATESVREGRRPERTVYRITEAGRAELLDWVRELIAVPDRDKPRFEAGLSVLGVLAPDEAIELLRRRADLLDAEIASSLDRLAKADVPRLFLIEGEYEVALREAEAAWVRRLLAELVDGTMPGVTQWRVYHETGEIPPELAELAERGSTKD